MDSDIDLSTVGIDRYFGSGKATISIELTNSPRFKQLDLDSSEDNQSSVDSSYGYYFRKDVAFFEFFSGQKLLVSDLLVPANADFVRVLLNYPLAAVFFQQGLFLLHASAVLYNEKTFVFPGRTQSGKSTIAAFLV